MTLEPSLLADLDDLQIALRVGPATAIDASALPPWLTLPRYGSTIHSTTETIDVVVNSSGVAERAAAYEADLAIFVASQQDETLMVPVIFTVTARLVAYSFSHTITNNPTSGGAVQARHTILCARSSVS